MAAGIGTGRAAADQLGVVAGEASPGVQAGTTNRRPAREVVAEKLAGAVVTASRSPAG